MKCLALFVKRLASVVALSIALGTAALAADIAPPVAPPLRAPAAYIPVAPPYPYNWSGFYIGGNLGAGFSNSDAQQTRSAARLGPQRPPPFWVAGRLASITNSGASSSSARRPSSIGFPIAKTP